MVRFFVSPAAIAHGAITLSAQDAVHIRSLRLRPDETFIVCDGDGTDYICRLGARENGAAAEIIDTRPSKGEATVTCEVYLALAKGDRLEYAVQKSVELGARSIVLFPAQRCVAMPDDLTKKTARLQKIAMETAKQCDRGRIPSVIAKNSFNEAVEQASFAGLPLFFYECEEKLHLKQALEQWEGADTGSGIRNSELMGNGGAARTFSLVIGPEGGFEPQEAQVARDAGMLVVSLGARILRCETAPVAALAAVMYHTGNL